MNADHKVMLALFEACLVESDFENLNHGDRDSLGVLQQRAGWGPASERMDVAKSVQKFVSRAIPIEGKYNTSGQLAQAVQVSAYPARYDLVAAHAESLLITASVANPHTVPNGPIAPITPPDNTGDSGLSAAVAAITNKQTWLRIAMFILGGFLVLFALMKMTGNNQLSDTTKTVVKAVGTAALA
jgi:hypothetical protein